MLEYVLDTGALLSTWTQKIREINLFTTPAVIDEVENRPSQIRVDTLISVGRLFVQEPSEGQRKKTERAATQYGDARTLSAADIGIIALALEKASQNDDVVLVSTDLAVLNTASHLGLEILDPTGRMKQRIKWIYQCPACGHTSKTVDEDKKCPVCGTEMRRRAAKKEHMA
ncbi:NOB1 family endonuclease [Candidatus Thorarchaeota archaeon]|nr:MAG: NOB1 family endonuclease [Candidatus Thorarchaeota archaeon]